MPTTILDLPEYYTSSGSMYLPVIDVNATGSNKNKKIRLSELIKSYQVSSNTSSFVSTGFGFGYFGDIVMV